MQSTLLSTQNTQTENKQSKQIKHKFQKLNTPSA